ncbi:hypothetical protein CLIB1423_37S00430 [[Candida] railenensis]|uniref:CBM21 domain-containing protein n=1 Tax=[Candida] railenensis TaxID=45579 RepID=A0A9P0W1Q6_9ASCO|nr:hypothetical protein CLIB1423_37S00430 [[Candida] railenensis]
MEKQRTLFHSLIKHYSPSSSPSPILSTPPHEHEHEQKYQQEHQKDEEMGSSKSRAKTSPSASPYDIGGNSPPTTKEPLSLKFIHKPSRSKELFEKAQDPTKANSQLNSKHAFDLSSSSQYTETDEINTEDDSECALVESASTVEYENPEEHHRLIRKKSGEVLKPLLKDTSTYSYFNKKRTQSLPTTPTYKQVHFGTGNDVRYFKKKDRPAAISASNSPMLEGSMKINGAEGDESYDDEDDSPYESDLDLDSDLHMDLDKHGSTVVKRLNSVDWHLKLPNFPELSYDAKIFENKSIVFLERLFISIDKKFLLGHVAVKNLAFEKSILVRYTFDHWSTIIEIPTIYVPDIPQILKKNHYDRFIFKIPLNSLFNSFRISNNNNTSNNSEPNTKSFQLCIKYTTDDTEFWDNNGFKNYDIHLTKIGSKKDSSKQVPSAAGPPPTQQLKALQTHTKQPRYSSSYLKRRSSDSTLEVKNHHHEKEEESKPDDEDKNVSNGSAGTTNVTSLNSPDAYFNSASPQVSSRIYGTNNSPFNYNFAFSNNSALSIDNNNYQISPIISLQTDTKKPNFDDKFKLNADGPPSAFDEGRRLSPTEEFSKLKDNKSASEPPSHQPVSKVNNALDAKSYKELLDTYCFFSKPDESVDENKSSKPPLTTVSSILGYQG